MSEKGGAMSRKQSAGMSAVSASNSDLARLIETEQRLGERLEAARCRCEALREQARHEALAAEAALEQELATLTATLTAQGDERLRLEISAIERDGRAAAERYASLDDPGSRRLAEAAVRQLRAPAGGPG